MMKQHPSRETEYTEKQKLEMELEHWKFNSHYWIEDHVGYMTCKWCKAQHSSETPMSGAPLCIHNPLIEDLLTGYQKDIEKWKNNYLEAVEEVQEWKSNTDRMKNIEHGRLLFLGPR